MAAAIEDEEERVVVAVVLEIGAVVEEAVAVAAIEVAAVDVEDEGAVRVQRYITNTSTPNARIN